MPLEFAIVYMTNALFSLRLSADRPVDTKKPAYWAGFFTGFFFRGSGGVASRRRNTSSEVGLDFGCGLLMAGV